MSSTTNETVIGIVVIARHGDRLGFFQDPTTYTASDTFITPLGLVQEHDLGGLLRSTYLTASSKKFIQGISPLLDNTQIKVRADTGDEGGVIFDSSIALLQGLYPPTPAQNTTLANGTFVTSPLNGYQYVPIESVEVNEDVSLEGHANCNTWNIRVTSIYNSSMFAARAAEVAPFLTALKPFLDERSNTLQNMYNIFDFLNVQSIHNPTFLKSLPSTFLPQARDLANWHEWLLFSDTSSGGIGNLDGQTIIPSLISGLNQVANASNPLKIHYTALSYKPFISLFNMTSVNTTSEATQQLDGIVNYAASLLFEVVNSTSNGVGVRMLFKNGTDDANYVPLTGGVLGDGGIAPLKDLVGVLQPFGINNTLQWCNACSNKVDRGCAAFFSGNATSSSSATCPGRSAVSDVGAGFIGAAVTVALVLGLIGIGVFMGLLHFGSRRKGSVVGKNSVHSDEMKNAR